jgi:hypothetical protein
MKHHSMNAVSNYDPSHPKWVCNKPSLKWLWLFVFDFIFNVTKKNNDPNSPTKKIEHDS